MGWLRNQDNSIEFSQYHKWLLSHWKIYSLVNNSSFRPFKRTQHVRLVIIKNMAVKKFAGKFTGYSWLENLVPVVTSFYVDMVYPKFVYQKLRFQEAFLVQMICLTPLDIKIQSGLPKILSTTVKMMWQPVL